MGVVSLDNGLPIVFTPSWIVEPYASRDACWGCGLEPAGQRNPINGLQLCFWCQELYEVDRANQHRGVGR